jgi:hypothetical protein
MHFHQTRQGRGPRRPKTVRPAFLLFGAAVVAYSTAFYPSPDLVQTAPVEAAAANPPNSAELQRGETRDIAAAKAAETMMTAEPELQVSIRFEQIENTDRAADLFATILRSVRSARARREREERA